jgi:hypothetical protein
MKRKVKIKPIYECRCNGRLQTKRFTRLAHTESVVKYVCMSLGPYGPCIFWTAASDPFLCLRFCSKILVTRESRHVSCLQSSEQNSLMCFYYQPKKVVTTLLQRRAYKAYSAVGRNTDNSQTLRVLESPKGAKISRRMSFFRGSHNENARIYLRTEGKSNFFTHPY